MKWFLNILEKLDRKRIIMDRVNNEPYLERYYLFLKDRKKFPFNIFLHKFLKGDPDDVHDHYTINTANATSAAIKYLKNRFMLGISYVTGTTPIAAVYELLFASHGTSTNLSTVTAVANTTTVPIGWTWSSIAEGRGAIYIAGYAGDKSAIFKIAPDSTGALGAAVSVADIPRGETVRSLFGYLVDL